MKFKPGDKICIYNVNNVTKIYKYKKLNQFIGLKFIIEHVWNSREGGYYTLCAPDHNSYMEINQYYWRDENFFTINENEI